MKVSADNVAVLIAKDVPIEKKVELFEQAKAMRDEGKTVIIQPMRKNVKQQIKMLEEEGYTTFQKVYKD